MRHRVRTGSGRGIVRHGKYNVTAENFFGLHAYRGCTKAAKFQGGPEFLVTLYIKLSIQRYMHWVVRLHSNAPSVLKANYN
jgi:hypothetical protein